jgi:valyl-tRNA synthetase
MEHIVHFLHPLMPFITEKLWTRVLDGPGLLATRPWPKPVVDDEAAAAEMEWLIRLISAVRTVRGEMNVPPSARIPLLIKGGDAKTGRRLTEHRDIILALARVSTVESIAEVPAQGALQVVVDELTVVLPVADVIDFAQEKARLTRDLAKVDGELGKIAGKLANPAFIDKAPLEVIEEQRERAEDLTSTRSRLSEALARLGQGS